MHAPPLLLAPRISPGATHTSLRLASGKETLWGARRAGTRDSRLTAGGLVEAAGEDEVVQHVLPRGRRSVSQSRKNIDVVETVPLPHCIHP